MNDDRTAELKKTKERVLKENDKFLTELKDAMDKAIITLKLTDVDFGFVVHDHIHHSINDGARIYGRAGIMIETERKKTSSRYAGSYGPVLGARLQAHPDWASTLRITARNRAFQGTAQEIAPKIVKMAAKYLAEYDVAKEKQDTKKAASSAATSKWMKVLMHIPHMAVADRARMPDPPEHIHKVAVFKAPGAAVLVSIHDEGVTLNLQTSIFGTPDLVKEQLTALVEHLKHADYERFRVNTEDQAHGDDD